MRKYIRRILVLAVVFCFAFTASAFAAEDWEDEFVDALIKGKEVTQTETEGLAYTPAEETVLQDAIKKAMDEEAPPCQCLKIAVNFDYNPYLVIKNIYGYGGEVDLDELCMCATEEGIMKEVIAKAAADAVTPLGDKVFDRDEITRSVCLEMGLPYTAAAADLPDPPEPPDPPPTSASAP